MASSEFGLELGRVIWKPHDDFYPLTVVLWGGVTVFSFLMCRSALVGLPYAVTLTEAGAMRLKTRGVLMVIFSAACISFCFGLCALASKRLGGLFPVAAIVFLMVLISIGFLVHRRLTQLWQGLSPD